MEHITLKDAAGRYFDGTGPLAAKLRQAAHKGLFSAALRMKRDIVTKVIPAKDPQPIDRGIYRAGWQVERLKDGAAVYNSTPHAAMVEFGVAAARVVLSTKAHLALTEWVHRKLGYETKRAWQIAGAILHAMKARGIFARGRGLRVMEGYVATSLPAVIREEVERELRKVTE